MNRMHTFRSSAILTIGTVVVAAISLLRGLDLGAQDLDRPAPVRTADQLVELDRLISDIDQTVQTTPTSSSLDLLGNLLLQRARVSGDAATLARASVIATNAVTKAPRNPTAQLLQAKVLYSNHRFGEAARVAETALAQKPKQAEFVAVLFDATVELGNTARAKELIDQLVSLSPGAPAAFVRRSKLAFLTGDSASALRDANLALSFAPRSGATGIDLAFYESFAGQAAFDAGDLDTARSHFTAALALVPDDRGAAFGMARTLGATGDLAGAIDLLQASADRFPEPATLALLGDFQQLNGQATDATNTYQLVEATAALAQANQQIYDRQITMFLADHKLRPTEALQMAQDELADRQDTYAYDTLAWAAFRAGDLDTAWTASQQALRGGSVDAAVLGHAGLIAAARGDQTWAKSLLSRSVAINAQFHPLVATEVRDALSAITRSA